MASLIAPVRYPWQQESLGAHAAGASAAGASESKSEPGESKTSSEPGPSPEAAPDPLARS
eukprot:gene31091-6220_t